MSDQTFAAGRTSRDVICDLLRTCRFDDAEKAIAALQATQADCAAKKQRVSALVWVDCAEIVARADRSNFDLILKEGELRFADAAFNTGFDAIRLRIGEYPDDLRERESLVKLLVRAGREDEALSEIEALERLAPENDELLVLRGLVAMRSQNWDAACAAWKAYSQKHGDDWNSANALDRLQRVRQLEQAADTLERAKPIQPVLHENADNRQLLLNFESIGSDCEFATVQRRFGAEPVGLLRWNHTTLCSLMPAVTAKFEGMGDPQNTRIHVSPSIHREIYLYDIRWNLPMNTFLYASEVSIEALLPKLCRRTIYLRERFLEDLSLGRKTLVFKSDSITEKELLELHDRFLELGPVRLLNVRLASGSQGFPSRKPGTVTELRPGLYVGRVNKFIMRLDAEYKDWIRICRSVERRIGLRRAAVSSAGVSLGEAPLPAARLETSCVSEQSGSTRATATLCRNHASSASYVMMPAEHRSWGHVS